MGDKPNMFYSDEEGSFYSKTVIEYLEGEKIEIHSHEVIQRLRNVFIRTYKDMLFKRVEADEKRVRKIYSG